jgi:hypothetical protein
LYGAFVWARRALGVQKRRVLARADARRREADRLAEAMADMPDEDGFVKIVRRRGRK